MAEDMKNKIEDLSTKPTTPSEEPVKEGAQGCGDVKEQEVVIEKDEAGKPEEDEGLVKVVVRAKVPTPPGKRPGPTTG
ncbi:unnamed protein product [Withania somnifera]